MLDELRVQCESKDKEIAELKEHLSGEKEYVLDRNDTDVLYRKLESKDNLINELQSEIEVLKSNGGFNFEPVNDDNNREIALSDEIKLKDSEIKELNDRISFLENNMLVKEEEIKDKEEQILSLKQEVENASLKGQYGTKEVEEKIQRIFELENEVSELKGKISEMQELISEKEEAITEQQRVIEQKTALVREKVEQLEAMKIEFGSFIKLKEELEEEKEKNEELSEIQKELEDSINDYEHRLGENESNSGKEENESLDLGDIFPIITDNSVLNARKIGYIREIGENPWLEDLVCYLSAMLKSNLQDTGIEPYFVILDDLSSDIRRMKYKEYDFTLNALPAFGSMPESNITVTSYTSIPDLKAHLNISNQDFIIFIDRYGKSKPYMKRRQVTEYNLVNNSELVKLCKLPKDSSLIATFAAKNLENCVEIPSDYALRGKRDRISLFLSKRAYTEVLENLETGLFK